MFKRRGNTEESFPECSSMVQQSYFFMSYNQLASWIMPGYDMFFKLFLVQHPRNLDRLSDAASKSQVLITALLGFPITTTASIVLLSPYFIVNAEKIITSVEAKIFNRGLFFSFPVHYLINNGIKRLRSLLYWSRTSALQLETGECHIWCRLPRRFMGCLPFLLQYN